MRALARLVLLALSPLLIGSLVGQPATREEVLAEAFARSPRIAAARERLLVAEANRTQSRLYPNPELELQQSDLRLGEEKGETEAMVAQPLVVGERRRAATVLANREIDLRRAELRGVVREVLAGADRLHTQMIYHHANLSSQWDLLEQAEATLDAAKERSGAASDVLRARISVDRIQLEVTRHAAERIYTLQQLQTAIGGTDLRTDRLRGELQTDFPVINDRIDVVANDPRHQQALAEVAIAEAKGQLARAERVPEITPFIGGAWDDAEDDSRAFVGVRIPLPLWDRQQGRIRSAKHEESSATLAASDLELLHQNEATENLQRINEYHTFVLEYRDSILPSATEALADARARYATGELPFVNLIDAQNVLVEARDTYFGYLLLFNEAVAARRALEGYPEERQLSDAKVQ